MLTVLTATYNRASTLAEVLRSYVDLEQPEGGWKLVVVDNGGTDSTPQVLEEFRTRLPLLSLVEPRRGKNVALNRGLSEVAGDLIVFTDDDCIPRRDWLQALRRCADSRPDFDIFGGVVLPRWEVTPAPWITAWVPLGPAFAVTDWAGDEGPATPGKIFGSNLAIRASVFASGYRFDESVGPRGSSYAMGSESELIKRLVKAGVKAWHCPSAVMEHIIRKSQLNREWVLQRAVRFGRGYYRQAAGEIPRLPVLWFNVPRYLIREILTQGARAAWAGLGGDARRAFEERWKLNFLIGQAMEARIVHGNREREGATQVHGSQ
jgi:glycosyltransferase involved in cell wall biosynthesis